MALAALLAAAVAFEADPVAPVVAGAAVAVLLVSLAVGTGRAAPIPIALVLFGSLYAIPDGDPLVWAPAYGFGLLLCSELAYWSLDTHVAQLVYGNVTAPRLVAVVLVAAASVPAGALVLLAAETGIGRSPATTAVAALAMASCAGLLAVWATGSGRAAQRTPRSTSTSS